MTEKYIRWIYPSNIKNKLFHVYLISIVVKALKFAYWLQVNTIQSLFACETIQE